MNLRKFYSWFVVLLIVGCSSDDNYEDVSEAITNIAIDSREEFPGGAVTVFDISPNAFGAAAPNLDAENSLFFFTGNSLFNQSWVTAPASTTARDGLGPFFNSRACSSCHFKDGRGRPQTDSGNKSSGILFRLSIPGQDEFGRNFPDPIYGDQFQDQSVQDLEPEGNVKITYTPLVVTYPDGETVSLRVPKYTFENLNYGALAANLQVSPRVANQMIGLGLLDAISETDILKNADETDVDNDGISGKPNRVYDIATNSLQLGRFGWKANQSTLKQQVAAAFAGDLGITSSLFPNENCPTGVDCDSIINGGNPEITDRNLGRVTLYASTLSVPARREFDDEAIQQGQQIFDQVNCIACHIKTFTTGVSEIKALENQVIFPYTDLLLHDMGEGLADQTPDFEATGTEWRTPPLWGIGLIQTVNNHMDLLHDGRARGVEEAILWHGGEAENSKQQFMNLKESERMKLIAFIESL